MKTLVICRHAKSDWDLGLPDFERPLSKRGKLDAPRMGRLLSGYDFEPDVIISSPAERAKCTALAVAKEIGYAKGAIRFEESIYSEGPGNLLGLIQDLDEKVEVAMVFGHNPTFENFVRMLLGMRAAFSMPTGAMVCIDFAVTDWNRIAPENASLQWFVIPRIVKYFEG